MINEKYSLGFNEIMSKYPKYKSKQAFELGFFPASIAQGYINAGVKIEIAGWNNAFGSEIVYYKKGA